jgi:hypothetical protein
LDLELARLGIDWLIVCGFCFPKVFPIDGGVLQDPFGDLEVRRVLKGHGMQRITPERKNLGAGKRQQNWRMRRDDEL